jgi:type I restriction enzyme S subunit
VQALHSVTDRLEVRQEKAKTQVSRLTQSILAKAFRGEIVPVEAALSRSEGREFETATELLDRIKNIRAKQLEYRPVNRQAPITKRSRTKALT